MQKFLTFMPFLLVSASVAAVDNDERQPHQLTDMIVSTPLPQSLADTALPVTVLSGDRLQMKIEPTIGETLKEEPGITSQSFGPGVGRPVIRGQTGSRVPVLQNGLSSLDVASQSPDHANSTEPLWAERIEVLRGPSTLLYGSGAIGGVVNVIDNRIPDHMPEKLIQGIVEQRYNTVNEGIRSGFNVDGGKGVFAWHVDGFYRESIDMQIPGYAIDTAAEAQGHGEDDHEHDAETVNSYGRLLNTNTRAKGGTAGFSMVGDPGFIGVSVNYLRNKYGIPPGAHVHAHEEDLHGDEFGDHEHGEGVHDDEFDEHDHEQVALEPEFDSVRIDQRQTRYDLKGELSQPFAFAESLRLRVGYNDYQHVELENGVPGTTYKNRGVVSRLELVQKPWMVFDHGVVGLQTENNTFSALGEEAFVPKSDINTFGVFTVQDIHTDHVVYELGLRVEQQFIDATGYRESSHTPVSFSASALWDITDNESISLSLSRSQRAPGVQELFADGPHLATLSYVIGNPGLIEESAHYLELGLHVDRGWVQGEFNFYQNWVNDYITQTNTGTFFDPGLESFTDICPEGDCLPIYRTEQRNAEFTGFEAQLTFPLVETAYGTLQTQLFGDYVRGRFSDGDDIPRMPPLRYGMQLSWQDDFWGANIRLTRVEDQDHPGLNETETGGYWLLNAAADYRYQLGDQTDLFLFVKGNNLLNQEIRNATSYLRNIAPEAARGVELGLRMAF